MSEADHRGARPYVVVGVLAVLAASNIATNTVLPGSWYVPWNLSVAVVLLALAQRAGGLALDDVGLARRDVRSGLQWGGLISGSIITVVLIAAVLPPTQGWFDDDIGRNDGADLAARLLISIPLGTVLMEEVAFRGVLPALLDRHQRSTRSVDLWCAVAFGLWHVLPSRGLAGRNDTLGSVADATFVGIWAPVLGAVLVTGVAGFALMWLRRRSASLIAPMLVHYALNASGTLAAFIAARR